MGLKYIHKNKKSGFHQTFYRSGTPRSNILTRKYFQFEVKDRIHYVQTFLSFVLMIGSNQLKFNRFDLFCLCGKIAQAH